MKRSIKLYALGCAVVLGSGLLTACNTGKGIIAGADQAVVDTVQGAKKDVKVIEKSVTPTHKKMMKKNSQTS